LDDTRVIKGDGGLSRLSMLVVLAQTGGMDIGQLIGGQGARKEKERIADRLAGFNVMDNPVWREITGRFGRKIKHPELLSIADVLAAHANIKLDRDAKRRKPVLVKWFNENWGSLRPYLRYVSLEDVHKS
jgi:hypothetical protein